MPVWSIEMRRNWYPNDCIRCTSCLQLLLSSRITRYPSTIIGRSTSFRCRTSCRCRRRRQFFPIPYRAIPIVWTKILLLLWRLDVTFTASSWVSGVREPLAGSKRLQPISYGRIMFPAWTPTDLRRQNLQGPELAGRGSAAATGLGASRAAIVVGFWLVYEFCEFSSRSTMRRRLSIERFQN